MPRNFRAFLERFRRITSAGNYIPEIDGLRFVSIFWVVVLLHGMNLVNQRLYEGGLISDSYWVAMFREGGYGVSLFMIISGFILTLPFIKARLYNGPKVSLKKYYLRRLTRLEPPYLVALTIAFIMFVVVLKTYSFSDLLPHYGASVVYIHNVAYGQQSLVLPVAWSLEVEVQFYIVAPFLSFIFLLKNHFWRRMILLIAILLSGLYAYYQFWSIPSILPNFICLFLAGMLLADLYCRPLAFVLNEKLGFTIGVIIFAGVPFLISIHSVYLYMIKMILIIFFFYLVLMNKRLKKIMSGQLITIIGGMCYSIYLLHFMIMSAVSELIKKFSLEGVAWMFVFYLIILMLAVLVISAVFYKLIEQPCMRKDWYKRIFRKSSDRPGLTNTVNTDDTD